MKKLYSLIALLLSFLFLSSSVFAGPPYFYRWASDPGATCSTPTANPVMTTGTRNFEYDTPASGTNVIRYRYDNGSLIGTTLWFTGSGIGTQTFGPYQLEFSGYPINYEDRFETVIDGVVVYHSSLFVSCSGDGAGTTSVVNLEVIPPPPPPATPVTSVIPPFNPNDGRINVHSQAPVVAYDDPIGIYAVNPQNSNGLLIIALSNEELDEQGIPSSGALLLASVTNPFNGLPVLLYRLPDGCFQLDAFYLDGKPYIIQWDSNGENLKIVQW